MAKAAKWWLAFALSAGLHGLGIAALTCLKVARHEDYASPPCEVSFISLEPVREPLPRFTSAILEICKVDPIVPPPGPPISKPNPPAHQAEIGSSAGSAQPGNPQSTAPDHGTSNSGSGIATTFFGVPAKGKTIVYLIDSSSSMGPSGALEMARRELLASLRGLPDGVRFQIIVFHSQSNSLLPASPGWLLPDAETLKRVESALRDLQAEGRTDYDQALKRALSLRPDVLYFLTDARDLPPRLIFDTTRVNAGRSTIHVIELGARVAPRPDNDLQMLARNNGGDFRQCSPLTP